MSFLIENDIIQIRQGDTGEFEINGLPTDDNYQVYFGVRDLEYTPVGPEIMVESFGNETILFKITAELSDFLEVPPESNTAKYFWGLKLCSEKEQTEQTVKTGTLIVLHKIVEGVANE